MHWGRKRRFKNIEQGLRIFEGNLKSQMKISFDLDDTLIPSRLGDFSTERRAAFQRWMGVEPIRQGAPALFASLKKAGHTVGIYTTSFRTKARIRFHLMTYRMYPDFVINEQMNRRVLQQYRVHSSKYATAFGIDLHIDDSVGVLMEGERLGFRVLLVDKMDEAWEEKVWKIVVGE